MNAIQNFLASRPDSADTLEGIHNWWIDWSGMPESIIITEQALHQLKEQGVIRSVVIGNREIWRRV
ncbi:hypothetical protein [Cellvibrio sp.]